MYKYLRMPVNVALGRIPKYCFAATAGAAYQILWLLLVGLKRTLGSERLGYALSLSLHGRCPEFLGLCYHYGFTPHYLLLWRPQDAYKSQGQAFGRRILVSLPSPLLSSSIFWVAWIAPTPQSLSQSHLCSVLLPLSHPV
ncbi:hypothetical protein BJ322DRAFT_579945 [Thelephora terrestris]|uniref:Uncharacterized protein n=1 Tax=Thelephora terrestris TaxID=56493 RepID=A0A9P6HIR3_9AGAM|nr:hypothetical protein BJ322DRAFT_579945 [Thelephora terrestris]